MLSQLSYGPLRTCKLKAALSKVQGEMVGLGRLELPTSRLSGVRSNHLSYKPEPQMLIHRCISNFGNRKRNEGGNVPHSASA